MKKITQGSMISNQFEFATEELWSKVLYGRTYNGQMTEYFIISTAKGPIEVYPICRSFPNWSLENDGTDNKSSSFFC